MNDGEYLNVEGATTADLNAVQDFDDVDSSDFEELSECSSIVAGEVQVSEPSVSRGRLQFGIFKIFRKDRKKKHASKDAFLTSYEVADRAKKYLSRRSSMWMDLDAAYSFVCNAVLERLLGEHGYIAGKLYPRRGYYRHILDYDICNSDQSVYRRDVVSILQALNVNRSTLNALSVEHYVAYRSNVGTYTLLAQPILEKLLIQGKREIRSCFELRLLYGHFFAIAEREKRDYEVRTELRSTSKFDVFGESKEQFNAVFLTDIFENDEERYHKFLNMLYSFYLSNGKTFSVMLPIVLRDAVEYISNEYNAFLSHAIMYPILVNEDQKRHCVEVFKTCLTSLERLSPAVQATNRGKSVEHLMADLHRIVEVLNIPDFTFVDPLNYNQRYDLESIAAALFVFYPGILLQANDLVMCKDGLRLLNIGERRLDLSHPFFEGKKRASKRQIAEDILDIFNRFRHSIGYLDWDVFIKEIKSICRLMNTGEFATEAQSSILREILNIGIVDKKGYDDRLGLVIYESFLPRVQEIEDFLHDEENLKLVKGCTQVLHMYDPYAKLTFLDVLFAGDDEESVPDPEVCRQFLSAVEMYRNLFIVPLKTHPPEESDTSLTPAPIREIEEEDKYQPSGLSLRAREKVLRTLSRRSVFGLLHNENPYFAVVITLIVLSVSTYCFGFILQMPHYYWVVGVLTLCSLVGVVASFMNCRDPRQYVMSIPQDVIGKESRELIKAMKVQIIEEEYEDSGNTVASITNDSSAEASCSHTKKGCYEEYVEDVGREIGTLVVSTPVVSQVCVESHCP